MKSNPQIAELSTNSFGLGETFIEYPAIANASHWRLIEAERFR